MAADDLVDETELPTFTPGAIDPGQLPDLIQESIARNNTLARVTLVPAYRAVSAFKRLGHTQSTYVLHASGFGKTDADGRTTVDVAVLLDVVGLGDPMHHGATLQPVRSPDADPLRVPGQPVMLGAAVVVATAQSDKPVVVTTDQRFTRTPDRTSNTVRASWFSPVPEVGSGSDRVTISTFHLDGTAAPRIFLAWHLTMELLFEINLGG